MSESISTPQRSTSLSPDSDSALDESLYDLTEEERTFFKQQVGISDDNELKAHIFRVQAEAYEVCIAAWKAKFTKLSISKKNQVHPYPCIRLFRFAK